MAATKFSKPIDNEIDSLNSNLTPIDVTNNITFESFVSETQNTKLFKIGNLRLLILSAYVGDLTAQISTTIGILSDSDKPRNNTWNGAYGFTGTENNAVLFVRLAVSSTTGAITVSSNSARTSLRVRGEIFWVV